ncbi:hypothetical protein [Bacterioplanoides sp.]|uniref:hypothetical protein n=1 Tax=Bacterioplanoides sp. TaxID=2066072 RepID=UPI003AFFB944
MNSIKSFKNNSLRSIDKVVVEIPSALSEQQAYINDQVRDGLKAQLQQHRFDRDLNLPALHLGVIETQPDTDADELVTEILRRFAQQLERAL